MDIFFQMGVSEQRDLEYGEIVVNGYRLPQIYCREHGYMATVALRASGLISEGQADLLKQEIMFASLPETLADLNRLIVLQVMDRMAAPDVATRLIKAAAAK